jgi:quercetin dioxygenase-like cupin family protein
MKTHLGTQSSLLAAWLLLALHYGPTAAAAEGEGFVVLPDRASHFSGPQGREADVTELLATREQTGGALGLFRQTIAPKSGPPTHIHQAEDEFFYVVNGEFKFKLGDRVVSAPARSIVFVPRGIAHTFQNVGTEPGVLLVGVTPGGFEKMFAERQDVDAETNRTLMKMHNMEVVGPPLQWLLLHIIMILELLEPKRQPVPIRTILTPPRQFDRLPDDPFEAEFEKRAIVDFEQPIRDVNSVVGIDADQVGIKGGLMELR